jgi:predicted  nucleic acid-binding Zn-ribbon protein
MTSRETDTPTLEADIEAAVSDALEAKNTGSKADLVDRAGNAILELVNRAAGTAAADLEEARGAAERFALQLQATRDQLQAAHDQINDLKAAAHDQINDLKADVRHYQDRANRAEKWLEQISSEIEQKFLSAHQKRSVLRGAPQQNENSPAAGLSFLRRRRDHH